MENIKDFIINILFIFSPLVFYPYVHRFRSNPRLYRFLMYVLFSVSLVASMTFPIDQQGLIYDLRSVPLAIGTLYGGIWIGAGLFATAVTYRALMDYPHMLIYALSIAPGFLVLSWLYRKFETPLIFKKMMLAIAGSMLIKFITFYIYLLSIGKLHLLFDHPIETAKTYLFQACIVGFYVYLIEFLFRHYEMQEEIVKSEKATIVSNMAASVAHEIRNPLTTVRGFIQILGSDDIDRSKKAYYQQICLQELDRAQQIITDYLSLAKPDPEVIENINLNEELNYLTSVLQTLANYNNTEIVSEPPADAAPVIVGDRAKFRQALINICKNAIEAMPGGGCLEIKARSGNGNVTLTISDTGTGMTPEQVKRLGTPYFSMKEKGTGLGTMVSFNIIRKMNGRIEVQSAPGKGTKFDILFPTASFPPSSG